MVFLHIWYNESVTSVALAPDRQTLAVGNNTGTILLYEVATGKEVARIKMKVPDNSPGGTAWVGGMVFTPDGKSIIAKTGFDQMLHQWDVAKGQETRKFGEADFMEERHGSLRMAFSADGKTFLAGVFHKSRVMHYERETGKELPFLNGPEGGFEVVAFAPDGKHSVWNGRQVTVLWDLAAGKRMHTFQDPWWPHTVSAIAFSPDSKTIAARYRDQSLAVWDVASGKRIRHLGLLTHQATLSTEALLGGHALSNLAFSPNGKHLAAGTAGNKVRQWDLETGQEIGQIAGPRGAVLSLGLSADGKRAVTRCYDNILHLWDTDNGRETNHVVLPKIAYMVFAADGRRMVLGADDGTLSLWDFLAGKEVKLWKTREGLLGLALSADGKTVASRDFQTISLWDASTGKELQRFPAGPVQEGISSAVFESAAVHIGSNMIFSSDGTLLASLSGDMDPLRARIRIMEARFPEIRARENRESSESKIHLWNVATGKQVRLIEVPMVAITSFAFAPDGRTIATANYDETISLLECASGKERQRFPANQIGPLEVLTFLPDGKTLIGAGHQDSTIHFWQVATGKELTQIQGHQAGISSLALAADGRTLISGSLDTTALIYPMPALKHRPPPMMEIDAVKAEALWNDLAGADAKKAGEAIRLLTSAPKQTLVLLRARLRPVTVPDPKRVAQLIADLDNDDFSVRSKATEELEKLGELAGEAIQKALAAEPNLEVRRRLELLRDRLVTEAPVPAETLRALRVLEVLEGVGTPEARQVVEALAKGTLGARLTQEAQATLKRLVNQ